MRSNNLSQVETSRKYEVGRSQIQQWERIYLIEGPEGFAIECRCRNSKGAKSSRKRLNCRESTSLPASSGLLRAPLVSEKAPVPTCDMSAL